MGIAFLGRIIGPKISWSGSKAAASQEDGLYVQDMIDVQGKKI
jgi:hypothetical protein